MTLDDEIKRVKKKLAELQRKKLDEQKALAWNFFKKNEIEFLLKDKEKLLEFSNEVMPIIEKFRSKNLHIVTKVAKNDE